VGDYNGFTNDERVKGGRIQTWAYKRGFLVRPLHCSACKIYGDVPGQIIAHLEDYTEPIKGAIFLCVRCHTMVHLREANQGQWDSYRAAIRDGWNWPLARGRWTVIADHVDLNGSSRPTRDSLPVDSTILDEIHDGLHHPGGREIWDEKMNRIMNNERVFWWPQPQEALF
jgi:hypothetical protein